MDRINQDPGRAGLLKMKHGVDAPEDRQAVKEKQLREACAGFEAIFLNTMLKSMRRGLPGDGVFAASNRMDIYQSMQDQYLAEELSRGKSSAGVREFLFQQLKDAL